MEFEMMLDKIALGVTLGVGALAMSSASVSAVVCRDNVCWHTTDRYEYPAESRVIIHPDNWRWRDHEHYVWREHEGRGYWRGRRWMEW
jgi:hypothetical protein